MDVKEIRLEEINPYENNPRNNDKAVEYVANSIREFGFKQPIVVDSGGVIIAGHTRYKAAQQLGLVTVPVLYADDLTDEQVKAYRLADNKVAEVATWNDLALLDELDEIVLDMEQFGFLEAIEHESIQEKPPIKKFTNAIDETKDYVVVTIDNDIDLANARTILGLEMVEGYTTGRNGKGTTQKAMQRVISWKELTERMRNA